MPAIELDSVEAFSEWLHSTLVTVTPLGLSLRLRPLPSTSRGSASQTSVLVVRPHVGHALLTLLHHETNESNTITEGEDDNEKGNPRHTYQPAEQNLREALPSSPQNLLVHSKTAGQPCNTAAAYAFILQRLLHLTSGNTDLRSVRSPSSACGAATAVADGVGRKLTFYGALLQHCAQWWGSTNGWREHALRTRFTQPFVFFTSTGVIAPPERLSGAHARGQQLRFLRVLRRLSEPEGWRLTWTPAGSEAGSSKMDWLDYLVEQVVHADLEPSGDYRPLNFKSTETRTEAETPKKAATTTSSTLSPGNESDAEAGAQQSCVPTFVDMSALRAVLWHILSTEVDSPALALLCGLLEQFVRLAASLITTTTSSSTETHDKRKEAFLPAACVRDALRCLTQAPDVAFACPPSNTSTAVVCGPLALSRVLPPGLRVLPFSDTHADFSSRGSSSSTPRFYLRGVPRTAATGAAQRDSLRVLLLRVDAEGGWLPPQEEAACRRTFFESFEQQAAESGGAAAVSRTVRGLADSDDEEDFAWREARTTGTRTVHPHEEASHGPTFPCAGASSPNASAAEDNFVSLLATLVMHQPPFAEAAAGGTAADRCLWRATVRLYTYALLHGVRVILTPEALPALTKLFGCRHLDALHGALRRVHAMRAENATGPQAPLGQLDNAHRGAACLAALCARDPPIAIYLVDRLDLHAFTQLQQTISGVSHRHDTTSSLLPLPVVLCRDVLRRPTMPLPDLGAAMPAVEAATAACGDASLPPGVARVTHCAVLDEEVTCRQWSTVESFAAAEVLMEACRGAERRWTVGRRDVCVVVVAPPDTVSDDNSESRHACRTKVDLSSAWCWPSILVVARTGAHTVFYTQVLRKAAAALLEAMSDTLSPPSAKLGGLVRGGGAFYVALAKQLHCLLRQLRRSNTVDCSATPRRHTHLNVDDSFQHACGVGWGDDLAHTDQRWVRYVLYLLAEACAAVATKHAEPVMASSNADMSDIDATSRAWVCGPRARQRLWVEVLRSTVAESTAVVTSAALPILHVHHVSAAPLHECEGSVDDASEAVLMQERAKPLTPDEVAMRVFASRRLAGRKSGRLMAGAAELGESELCAPPLFEPLATNIRVVREALSLLCLSLSAAVTTPSV